MHAAGNTLGKLQTAFQFSERARARAFLEKVGQVRTAKLNRHPLANRRETLTRQILNDDISGPDENRTKLSELRMIRSQIISDAPEVAAITEGELPEVHQLADLLPSGAALVEFFVDSRQYLTTFVLKPDGKLSLQTLDLAELRLDVVVKRFREELESQDKDVPTGELLFSILFGTIWSDIADAERLLIVPHKILHSVPFAALWFKNSGTGPQKLFLCQRFWLSILPSASVLVQFEKRPQRPIASGHSLVMGNPARDLPDAEEEAKLVAERLGTTALIGDEATTAKLLNSGCEYSVIHIACHGIEDPPDPLLAGIELADGPITAEGFMESDVRAGLLTLSACLTGVGRSEPGDELVTLSRSAASAGIASVVSTLLPFFDWSAPMFFDEFYRNLLLGMPKDCALGSAQQAMIASPTAAHPVHWAPFVLLGSWR
jgi:CHAT domain-containing protein